MTKRWMIVHGFVRKVLSVKYIQQHLLSAYIRSPLWQKITTWTLFLVFSAGAEQLLCAIEQRGDIQKLHKRHDLEAAFGCQIW